MTAEARYTGRRAVVLGGTSGIGLATARMLVDEGARVLVTGRSAVGVAEVQRTLGPNAQAVVSDMTSAGDLDVLASEAERRLGSIDLLFQSAGMNSVEPFSAVTFDRFDEVFAANARAPYFAVQRLAPLVVDGDRSC